MAPSSTTFASTYILMLTVRSVPLTINWSSTASMRTFERMGIAGFAATMLWIFPIKLTRSILEMTAFIRTYLTFQAKIMDYAPNCQVLGTGEEAALHESSDSIAKSDQSNRPKCDFICRFPRGEIFVLF